MKTKQELEEWSYPRRDGYERCKEDVLKLIDETMCFSNKKSLTPENRTWNKRLEELKKRIEGK